MVATYIPPFNGNDKERQLWFYDITEGKFLDIGDKDMFKDKIATNSGSNSDFTFLDDNKVHITNSSLPDIVGFNVLDMRTGKTESYYNFKDTKDNVAVTKPNKINTNYIKICFTIFFLK